MKKLLENNFKVLTKSSMFISETYGIEITKFNEEPGEQHPKRRKTSGMVY